MFMELWEHKWKEFIKTEDLGRDSESGEFPHGEAIYRRLPQFLYHMTYRSTLNKISKQGYLGFRYREHNHTDERGWQKAGWGVFFGTNPEACRGYMSSAIDRDKPLVCLRVNKGKLNPEKFYVDEDLAYGYSDFDEINIEDISVFYADKVPFSDIEVISDLNEKPDFSAYSNSRESRRKNLQRPREFVEEKLQQCFKEPLKFRYPTEEAVEHHNVDAESVLVLTHFTLMGGKVKCRGFRVYFNVDRKQYEILTYLSNPYSAYGRLEKELQRIFTPFCNSVKSSVYLTDYKRLEWDIRYY